MVVVTDTRRVALVTDATTGIGPALVKKLSTRVKGVVYLTASSQREGQDAFDMLKKEGFTPNLRIVNLMEDCEVRSLAAEIKKEHGGLDIMIANTKKEFPQSLTVSYQQAESMVQGNLLARICLLQHMLPIMRAHGRIVLNITQPGIHFGRDILREKAHPAMQALSGAKGATLEGLKQAVAAYLQSAAEDKPWLEQPEILCTMANYALVQMVARNLQHCHDDRSLLINVGSPGWLLTAEGKTYLDAKQSFKGEKGVDMERGAADIDWLAKLPRGCRYPNGMIVKQRKVVQWNQ